MGIRGILAACSVLFAYPASPLQAGEPTELSAGLSSAAILSTDDSRLVLIGSPRSEGKDPLQIVAINPTDGKELWRTGARKGRAEIDLLETGLLCIHGDGPANEDMLLDLESGGKSPCPAGARVAGLSSGFVCAWDSAQGKVLRLNRDGSVESAWLSETRPIRRILTHEKGFVATLQKEAVAVGADGQVAWRWAYPEGFEVRGETLHLWKDTVLISNLASEQPVAWMLELATGKLRSTIDFQTCTPGVTYSRLRWREDCKGSGRFLLFSGMASVKAKSSMHSSTVVIDVQSGKLVREEDEVVACLSPDDVAVVKWSQTSGKIGEKNWKMENGTYGFDLAAKRQVWRKGSIHENCLSAAYHCTMDTASQTWRYEIYSNKDGKRCLAIPIPKGLTKEGIQRLKDAFDGKETPGGPLFGQRALPGEVFVFRFEQTFVICFTDAGRLTQVELPKDETIVSAGLAGEKACFSTSGGRVLVCPTTK